MLDEIYSGELGDHEQEIKHVVQSRKANRSKDGAKYVQDEVRVQADIVWYVINALDGRVFVCGSSKGMGEGVHSALVDVSMEKGGLNRDQAQKFWESKKEGGQYIAVSTVSNLLPLLTTLTFRAGNLVILIAWSSWSSTFATVYIAAILIVKRPESLNDLIVIGDNGVTLGKVLTRIVCASG